MNEKFGELIHDQPLQKLLERAALLLDSYATDQFGWSSEDLEGVKAVMRRLWTEKSISINVEDGAGSTYLDDAGKQDEANFLSALFYVHVAEEAQKDEMLDLAWSRCVRIFQLIGRLETVSELELRVEQTLQPMANGRGKSQDLKIKAVELLVEHRPPSGWQTIAQARKAIADPLGDYEISTDENAKYHTIEARIARWFTDDDLFAAACTALVEPPPAAKP